MAVQVPDAASDLLVQLFDEKLKPPPVYAVDVPGWVSVRVTAVAATFALRVMVTDWDVEVLIIPMVGDEDVVAVMMSLAVAACAEGAGTANAASRSADAAPMRPRPVLVGFGGNIA